MILQCTVLQSNQEEIELKKERFGDIPGLEDEIELIWTNASILLQAVDCVYECVEHENASVVMFQSGGSIVVGVRYEELHALWNELDNQVYGTQDINTDEGND